MECGAHRARRIAGGTRSARKLCRTYWRPVHGFIRRQGVRQEEVEDLTQGFFALLLEGRDLDAVRKEKGRLRSYLLTAVKHFLASEQRRSMTLKRGKGQRLVPLEELSGADQIELQSAEPASAEMIYERRWALTLMDQVLRRLKDEYHAAGNAELFDCLKQLLPDEPGAPSRAEIAARLGMTAERSSTSFPSIPPSLPGSVARGDRQHRRDCERYRR